MRGAIDWSYRLLDEEAQATFRALGVFAGAVGLDAIEQVVGPPASPDAMETLLDASLVVHSIDRSGEPRFGLLETLREYAVGELDAAGELERLRRSHAAFYVAVVEGVETDRGPGGSSRPRRSGSSTTAIRRSSEHSATSPRTTLTR